MSARAATGREGEQIAARHLQGQGFEILATNARVGRLELDLVARSGDLLVFCEVRTRTRATFMDPIESIDANKRSRIRRAALMWLKEQRLFARELRFDAASVVLEPEPRLTYYEQAF